MYWRFTEGEGNLTPPFTIALTVYDKTRAYFKTDRGEIFGEGTDVFYYPRFLYALRESKRGILTVDNEIVGQGGKSGGFCLRAVIGRGGYRYIAVLFAVFNSEDY